MIKIILVAACAILLGACGKDAPDQPSREPVLVEVEPVLAENAIGQEFLNSSDPLAFEFPHELSYDRTRTVDEGTERQVLLEVVDADVDTVTSSLEAFMEERGYEKSYEGEARGGTRMIFSSEGSPKVTIRIWPPGAGPVELVTPNATGSVYINWILPETQG